VEILIGVLSWTIIVSVVVCMLWFSISMVVGMVMAMISSTKKEDDW